VKPRYGLSMNWSKSAWPQHGNQAFILITVE
jgi:hypothetical protein